MQETSLLIEVLKRCLRSANLTYADVAKALDLSEASIKRIFSEQRFSLRRLEAVCRLMNMSVADLCRLAEHQAALPRVLGLKQETELADDPELLKYFYRLLSGWDHQTINQRQGLTEHQGTRLLARLDRLGLIELLPGNHVKIKTAKPVEWRRDGPLWRRYAEAVQEDFMAPGFQAPEAALQFESGEISAANRELLERKLVRLARDFREMVELDSALEPAQRLHVGLLMAMRPWLFTPLFAGEQR